MMFHFFCQIYLAIGLGILRVFCVDGSIHLATAPIDYVNNATIAAVWHSIENAKKGKKDIPIYTIAKKERFLQWGMYFISSKLSSSAYTCPLHP